MHWQTVPFDLVAFGSQVNFITFSQLVFLPFDHGIAASADLEIVVVPQGCC